LDGAATSEEFCVWSGNCYGGGCRSEVSKPRHGWREAA
jgi:hypothetical protein